MEEKLKNRVCALAGVALGDVPKDVRKLLESRVQQWVERRSVTDQQVQALASELSSLRLPQRSATSMDDHRVIRANEATEGVRALSVEPSIAKNGQVKWPPRPQVLRRMQLLVADKDVQESISREAILLEEQRKQALESKLALRTLARQELAAVERKRVEAKEAAKREREENNRLIRQSLEEAKAAENDAACQRRARCIAERQAIEVQRELDRAREEREKQLKREENERIRRMADEELAEKEAVERERAAVMKQSLVDFLNEGLSVLRKKEPEVVVSTNVSRMRVTEEILAARERKIAERNASLEQRRKIVASQVAEETAAEKQRRLNEEKRIAAAAHTLEQAQRDRAEREQKEKELVRQLLVSSLEEEIAFQRAQQVLAEDEKRRIREQLAAEASAEAQRKAAERKSVVEAQRQRKQQMDLQMEQRLLCMLTPTPSPTPNL